MIEMETMERVRGDKRGRLYELMRCTRHRKGKEGKGSKRIKMGLLVDRV